MSRPNFLLILLHILKICLSKVRLSSIMMPSNLASFTCLIGLSSTLRYKVQFVKVALHWCVLRSIQTVLSVVQMSLFSFSLLLKASRSSFNCCSSTDRSGSQACKVVSSAYTSNICLIASGASFINIMNKKGPRMDPCGTPIITGCSSERDRLKLTCWIRLDKYDLNHSSSLPSTPYATSFLSNVPWSTVSNAFLRSIKIAPTKFPLSNPFRKSSYIFY